MNKNIIINKLSLKYGISKKEIKQLVESQFEFTSYKIKNVPIKELSIEELDKLKTTFRYMELGALHINKKKLKHIKKNEIKS